VTLGLINYRGSFVNGYSSFCPVYQLTLQYEPIDFHHFVWARYVILAADLAERKEWVRKHTLEYGLCQQSLHKQYRDFRGREWTPANKFLPSLSRTITAELLDDLISIVACCKPLTILNTSGAVLPGEIAYLLSQLRQPISHDMVFHRSVPFVCDNGIQGAVLRRGNYTLQLSIRRLGGSKLALEAADKFIRLAAFFAKLSFQSPVTCCDPRYVLLLGLDLGLALVQCGVEVNSEILGLLYFLLLSFHLGLAFV
jgi:hypothetical protein